LNRHLEIRLEKYEFLKIRHPTRFQPADDGREVLSEEFSVI